MKKTMMLAAITAMITMGAAPTLAMPDGAKIFKKKCSMCHKIDKKKVGPAVKDMNTDPAVLKNVIANGRRMMPKFGSKLSDEEIDALVAFIQSHQPGAANPCAKNPCGQ